MRCVIPDEIKSKHRRRRDRWGSVVLIAMAGMLMMDINLFASQAVGLSCDQSDSSPYTVGMGEEMALFQEIPSVYGASRYEQKLTEAPSSVTIITASDIAKYGYRTLADILQSAAGFFTTYDRNYSYLGIRGFGRPGDYNSRVLLLIDGHRANDDIYGQAPTGTDFPVDVDLIEKVEIIRGPSSSIYGSNAFLGVINVITKQGRGIKGLEMSGEAGSFETYKGRFTYGDKFSNGLELLLSGSYYDSRGQDLYFKEFDRPSTNHGVAEGVDDDLYRSLFSKFVYHDFTLEAAYNFRDKGIPTTSWDTAFNDFRSQTTDERAFVDLKYEHTFQNQFRLMARAYYDQYNYDGNYVYGVKNPVLNKDGARSESVGAEIQASKRLFDKHTVLVGGEYRNSLRQDQFTYDEEPYYVYLDDKRQSQNFALYAQDEFQIFEPLTLSAGVRYDWYETFGGTINPRLGLIYHPFEQTVLKLLYGQAFRAPNAYELYYGSDDSIRASLKLEPEEIKTYELVWEQYFGDHLRMSVSGFYYDVKNLISFVEQSDGSLMFENVEEVDSKGVEWELERKWVSGIEARLNYSFQDTRDKRTGELLTNSPQHLAKLNVIWPLVREKLFAGTELQYSSVRKTLSGRETDDYFLMNFTLYAQRLWKGLDLSASVYNVFDQDYAHPGFEEHRQDAIPQDGITFRVKLTYSF